MRVCKYSWCKQRCFLIRAYSTLATLSFIYFRGPALPLFRVNNALANTLHKCIVYTEACRTALWCTLFAIHFGPLLVQWLNNESFRLICFAVCIPFPHWSLVVCCQRCCSAMSAISPSAFLDEFVCVRTCPARMCVCIIRTNGTSSNE